MCYFVKTMKKFLSTSEAAKILKISSVAIFKKIKKGELPAQRVGRSYAIDPLDLGIRDRCFGIDTKKSIKKAVKLIVKEYGKTLRKLGKE